MGNAFSSCVLKDAGQRCHSRGSKSKKRSKKRSGERVLPSDLHSSGGTIKVERTSTSASGDGYQTRPSIIKVQNTDENFSSFPLHGIQKSSPITPMSLRCHDNIKSAEHVVDDQSVTSFFNQYRDVIDSNGGMIKVDGIEKLCSDLRVSHTDFIVLVLAWKLKAETMCQFTFEEFTTGCKSLQVDSIASLMFKLDEMEKEALEKDNFKDLYRYTFQFSLDHDLGQRTLERDIAIAMWEIVFSRNTPAILNDWTNYLNDNNVRGISRDTWNMFLLLVESLDTSDYSNYDVTEAWPSLFDEFVEFNRKKLQMREEEVAEVKPETSQVMSHPLEKQSSHSSTDDEIAVVTSSESSSSSSSPDFLIRADVIKSDDVAINLLTS